MTHPLRIQSVQNVLAELERVSALSRDDLKSFLQFGVPVYWADVLHQPLNAPHPPQWCGAFALWNLHKVGLGLELRWMFGPPNYGFCYKLEQLARPALAAELGLPLPEPGDIAYLDKPYQHHATVVCVEGDTVVTVDGNQGPLQPIKRCEHPLSHWTAFYSIARLLEPENIA